MIITSRYEEEILKEMHRDIVNCFLELFILAKLKSCAPLSGYDFVETIQKQFSFGLSPGTVYSTLYSLERKGLIKSLAVGSIKNRKREYTLTEKGKKLLSINAKFEDDIVSFVRKVLVG